MTTDACAPTQTVHIETFGCQMNALDSELVGSQLAQQGYTRATSAEAADVILINTCSVRALSEQKVWSMLGRLAQLKSRQPERLVGVLGCMAERQAEALVRRMPHVDVICGPSRLDHLPRLLMARRQSGQPQVAVSGHTSRRSATQALAEESGLEALDQSRSVSQSIGDALPQYEGEATAFQAYVRITRGCNKFCSFCIVPFVRGPEVHRAPEQIVMEVKRLVDEGVREVTLLGQTVNHYTHCTGGKTTSFADLLYLIHEQVPALARLRFLTSYPRDFGDDALDVMAACPRIANYLHIPAQSGSNRMLKKMNRGYTIEAYEALLERARARMPDIRIAGDMIVGYPTETDEDHLASEAFLRRAQLKSCYIFKYSPREGTVSAKRHPDDVSESDKKARHQALLSLQQSISKQLYKQRIDSRLMVLVEGRGRVEQSTVPQPALIQLGRAAQAQVPLLGRTEGDEIMAFMGTPQSIGHLVPVQVTGVSGLTLTGTLCAT